MNISQEKKHMVKLGDIRLKYNDKIFTEVLVKSEDRAN